MSSRSPPPEDVASFRDRYQRGPGQFVRWVHDKLPVRLSDAQQRLLRAVAEHRRTLVLGANGPGKSYAAACLTEAFLHSRRPSTVLATSGTYGKLKRTLCRPVEALQRDGTVDGEAGLPGEYKHSPPRVDTGDPEWYFEASRPKDAGELEGTHNDHLLAITEEADKETVDADVLESIDSCLTDTNDRHLVIANPPKDEGNVVHDLMRSDAWHVERLATWDSRNVRVDAGGHDGPKIPGLLGLSEVRESWETWNGEPWPGIDEARTAHEHRDDLDTRWYRRRAGVMPPQGASAHRPIDVGAVRAAYDRTPGRTRETPSAVGIDVARSGDETVVVGLHDTEFRVHYAEQGTNHTVQAEAITALLDEWASPEIAVDAVGEGSHLADELDARYPNVTRFKSGSEAAADQTYRHKWAEALAHLGDVLAQGAFASTELRRQALAAARTIAFEERYLKSRDATVLQATSKESVTDTLGHSPDYLDAAAMAAWAEHVDQADSRVAPTWSF